MYIGPYPRQASFLKSDLYITVPPRHRARIHETLVPSGFFSDSKGVIKSSLHPAAFLPKNFFFSFFFFTLRPESQALDFRKRTHAAKIWKREPACLLHWLYRGKFTIFPFGHLYYSTVFPFVKSVLKKSFKNFYFLSVLHIFHFMLVNRIS